MQGINYMDMDVKQIYLQSEMGLFLVPVEFVF